MDSYLYIRHMQLHAQKCKQKEGKQRKNVSLLKELLMLIYLFYKKNNLKNNLQNSHLMSTQLVQKEKKNAKREKNFNKRGILIGW